MGYDANDEKQVKKARKQADFNKALELDVIRGIMKSPAGRKWVYGKLERCHIYGNPFVEGQPDTTAFKLGESNIGRMFLADVQEADAEAYLVMIREAKNDT